MLIRTFLHCSCRPASNPSRVWRQDFNKRRGRRGRVSLPTVRTCASGVGNGVALGREWQQARRKPGFNDACFLFPAQARRPLEPRSSRIIFFTGPRFSRASLLHPHTMLQKDV
jgi:hypothetical protein